MNSINGLHNNLPMAQPEVRESAVEKSSKAFGAIIKDMVRETDADQKNGDLAVQNLQSGKSQHLHEVMIAVEEAEVSLKMLVQMRNKALTAYEEIMRMQI
jgi:flagellar hook-basal body complex protein FliE